MSTIPFSSRDYLAHELDANGIPQILAFSSQWREKCKLIETSHLSPLKNELDILQRFLVRHAVPLRHEKGIRLVRRVVQCVKRIFNHPDVDVVRMTSNLLDLCRDRDNEKTLPSRQTSQHYLAALNRTLTLYDASSSHATNAYAYLSSLLTVGHLIPAYLTFAASVARIAVLLRGLRGTVASLYEEFRPWIHALKGENADLASIYGENPCPEVISKFGRDGTFCTSNFESSDNGNNVDGNKSDDFLPKGMEDCAGRDEKASIEEEEDIGEAISASKPIKDEADSSFSMKKKAKKKAIENAPFQKTEVGKVSDASSSKNDDGKQTKTPENWTGVSATGNQEISKLVGKAAHHNGLVGGKKKKKRNGAGGEPLLFTSELKVETASKIKKPKGHQNAPCVGLASTANGFGVSFTPHEISQQSKNAAQDEIDDIFGDFL